MEAHDDVAAGNFEELPDFIPMASPPPQLLYSNGVQDAVRMVGVRKNPEEPLVCCFIAFITFLMTQTFNIAIYEFIY